MIPLPFIPATGMSICPCLHYLSWTWADLSKGKVFPLLQISPDRGATLSSLLPRPNAALVFTFREGNGGPGASKWHTRQWQVLLTAACHSTFPFCFLFSYSFSFAIPLPLLLISCCLFSFSEALELTNGDPYYIYHFPSQCRQDMFCCSWKSK